MNAALHRTTVERLFGPLAKVVDCAVPADNHRLVVRMVSWTWLIEAILGQDTLLARANRALTRDARIRGFLWAPPLEEP